MKKKKIIILVTICLGVIFLFNYEHIKGFFYLNFISYDMELYYHEPLTYGGYATTTTYYRINTKKKKEYIIEEYNVYSDIASFWEKGFHYSLEQIELTEEQINKLKKYAYGESTYTKSFPDSIHSRDYYVTIVYDGQSKSYYLMDFQYK